MIFKYKRMLMIDNDVNDIFKVLLYEERRKLIHKCPHCNSKHFIKFGRYNGIQRFRCKNCRKTFSLTTNSVWYYSKKKVADWTNYIEAMLEKQSLRLVANRLKISVTTAFYWRHKVMDAECTGDKVDLLKENVHILSDRIAENHKGSRNIQKYNSSHIWIVTAKGGQDRIISEPISKGIWSYKKFNEKIYNKISKKSFIISYQNRYINSVARKHNKNLSEPIDDNIDITVQNYMNTYAAWFSDFRGVASKYLKEYLHWFMMFYREKKYYCFGFTREIVKVMKYIRTFEIGYEE